MEYIQIFYSLTLKELKILRPVKMGIDFSQFIVQNDMLILSTIDIKDV